MRNIISFSFMKTVSVREMKAHWADIERQVANGEIFEVLNRGKPAARIIAPNPRKILKWTSHLDQAIKAKGQSGSDTVVEQRGERW